MIPRLLWASRDTAQRSSVEKQNVGDNWREQRRPAMERQGSHTADSSQNTGPQSVSKQRNLGAPPDYTPWEDLRLLLTLVFFGRKIKAPTQLLHAPIGSALHVCQTNTAASLTAWPDCPGRDSWDQRESSSFTRLSTLTAVNWAAPFIHQPVTTMHKRNKFSSLSLCFIASVTPGTAGNSCRGEFSGKRKAEHRATRTHKMRWEHTCYWGSPTTQFPPGLSWPCLDWAITSKAGSDPASIKISGKTPSHISSSGLNSWRLWISQVHSHACRILNACITYNLSTRGNADQFMPRHNSHAGKPKEQQHPFFSTVWKQPSIQFMDTNLFRSIPSSDTAAACIPKGCANDLADWHVPNDTAECLKPWKKTLSCLHWLWGEKNAIWLLHKF